MKLGSAYAQCENPGCHDFFSFSVVQNDNGEWVPDLTNGKTPFCHCGCKKSRIIEIAEDVLLKEAPVRTGRRIGKNIEEDFGEEFDEF